MRLCLTSPPGSDCASTRTWASGSDPGAGPSGPPDYGRMRARSWGLTGAVPGARRHSGAWSGLWQLERTARSGRQKSYSRAPVAQLDRVPGYEPGGREFESLRARQSANVYSEWRRCGATEVVRPAALPNHGPAVEGRTTELRTKRSCTPSPLSISPTGSPAPGRVVRRQSSHRAIERVGGKYRRQTGFTPLSGVVCQSLCHTSHPAFNSNASRGT